MLGRLIGVSLLAGIIAPAGNALASSPHGPVTPPGSIGIRLVDAPTSRDPLARLYVVDALAPGTSIRRRIEISNSTGTTASVAVYPAAAGFHRGKFGFAPGHTRNELSTWTSVAPRILLLSPGTKAVDTVTINVPRNASRGERYAVIWAETSTPARAGGGVRLVNRVGVRMYLSIGPGGAARANFTIGPLGAKRSAAGVPSVVARVDNSGQRTLDISGTLTLSRGPGGLRAGPFPVRLATAVMPRKSETVTVRLAKGLPRGPWRAQLRLRSGILQRVAVRTITFPRVVPLSTSPGTKAGLAAVARLILIAVVLALLAGLALVGGLFYRGAGRVA